MAIVRLQTLAARFWSESDQTRRRFAHVFPTGHETCSNLHGWTQEMCLIRLQDAWARFCRELVLVSASEEPLTAAGIKLALAPGINRRSDALNRLRSIYNRFPHEPKWFDPQACLRGATILNVANYAAISAGIGVTPSPLDDLRDLRNFVAHRSEQTAAQVRAAAVRNHLSQNHGVIAILESPSVTPPGTILQVWTEQLQTMAQIATR